MLVLVGFLAAIFNAIVWGACAVLAKLALRDASWPVVGFLSFAGTSAIQLAWMLLFGRARLQQFAHAYRPLLLIGLVGSVINLLWFVGIDLSDPTSVSIIQRTQILFAILLGWLALRERPRPADLPAVGAMVVGFLVMQLAGGSFEARAVGNLLVLASAFLLALNSLLIKKLSFTTSVAVISLGNCMLIAFAIGCVCVATGADFSAVRKPACALAIAAMSLSLTGSFLLYYFALSRLEIWKVSVLLLLVPVTTSVLQSPVLGEKLTPRQIVGMVLIIAGAVVLILIHQRRAQLMPINRTSVRKYSKWSQ